MDNTIMDGTEMMDGIIMEDFEEDNPDVLEDVYDPDASNDKEDKDKDKTTDGDKPKKGVSLKALKYMKKREERQQREKAKKQDKEIIKGKSVRSYAEMNRHYWGAPDVKGKMPLSLPIAKIQFVYGTDTETCRTKKECIRRVREIDKRDRLLHGMQEINVNFLVGGDGRMYEGRGFRTSCVSTFTTIYHALVVAFIGDWRGKEPTKNYHITVDHFLKKHIEKKNIAPLWKKYTLRF